MVLFQKYNSAITKVIINILACSSCQQTFPVKSKTVSILGFEDPWSLTWLLSSATLAQTVCTGVSGSYKNWQQDRTGPQAIFANPWQIELRTCLCAYPIMDMYFVSHLLFRCMLCHTFSSYRAFLTQYSALTCCTLFILWTDQTVHEH